MRNRHFTGKLSAIILILMICVLNCAVTAFADSNLPAYDEFRTLEDHTPVENGVRVYDYANLLNDNEESSINETISELSAKTNLDIVVVTEDEGVDGYYTAFADDFYDYNGFGFDESNSGVLLFIDMEDRVVWMSTTGKAISIFTDSRIQNITDECARYLGKEYYYGAVSSFLNDFKSYTVKSINGAEAIVAVVLAGITFALIFLITCKRYKTNGQECSYDVDKNADLYIAGSFDNLIDVRHRTVHIVSSSGGGGSSTHSGSSGSSHGGGGSSF